MAAEYTKITIEDMDRFLKRAFRALRPKQGLDRGEYFYDLNVSDSKIFIRIWTSIKKDGAGAGVGLDAIRPTLVTVGGKPLVRKQKIVKRTPNWRGNLQERIETLLEDYESKTGYWKGKQQERDSEQEAGPPVSAPTPDPIPMRGPHQGSFAKDRSGSWVAKIPSEGHRGDDAVLQRKSGQSLRVVLVDRVWKGRDRFSGKYVELWTFEARGGRYASQQQITSALVAERALGGVEDFDGDDST